MLFLWLYLGGAALTSFCCGVSTYVTPSAVPLWVMLWPFGLPLLAGEHTRLYLKDRAERRKEDRRLSLERQRVELQEREKWLLAPMPWEEKESQQPGTKT